VDRGDVRDDNSHYQDEGVFDEADHGIDDDDFDYEELLRHVEPQVLNSQDSTHSLSFLSSGSYSHPAEVKISRRLNHTKSSCALSLIPSLSLSHSYL
jgi:hypothetical protein